MAKFKADLCMFCECEPCQCNKPTKRTRTTAPSQVPLSPPKVPSQAPKPPPSPKPPTKIPGAAQSEFTRAVPKAQAIREVQSEEDADLYRAITVLAAAGLLGHEDLARHRSKIDLPSWKIDALIWRQRNATTTSSGFAPKA